MNDSTAQKQRELRASGCLGFLVGWIGLGFLTSFCFAWFDADYVGSTMVILFRGDGGILGAATGLALTRFRQKEPRGAALICLGASVFVFASYAILFSLGSLSGEKQNSTDSNGMIWLFPVLLWSAILFVCGLRLRKRAIV